MDRTQPDAQAQPYELFMLGLCVYVLLALGVGTVLDLDPAARTILETVDTGICLIFLGDFITRLIRAPSKLQYLKWGWIDLASSIPMIPVLRVGRAGRILRILRVLRGLRSTKIISEFILARRAEGAFLAAALLSILLIAFSSIAMLTLETSPDANIKTPEDALWWAFVTITTVGYGDRYPTSTEGRVLAAIVMTAGVGLFGTFTGFVASWFLESQQKGQENELEAVRTELAALRNLLIERGESGRW